MLKINKVVELRSKIKLLHLNNKCVSLIPTMGSLHDGHLALVKQARKISDFLIVTIFINPIQFNKVDDFISYPRNLTNDLLKLDRCNVDLVFTPTTEEIYSTNINEQTFIEVPYISSIFEGLSRPGHFRGVTTIIGKFLNIINPNLILLGEKDYQQLIIIKRMITDLNYNVNVISIPIVRDKNGLALSTRNIFLTKDEYRKASLINQILRKISVFLLENNLNIKGAIEYGIQEFTTNKLQIDRLDICDADTLSTFNRKTSLKIIILVSIYFSKTRLIDNYQISLKS